MLKHVYLRVMNVQKILKKQKGSNGKSFLKGSCVDKEKNLKIETSSLSAKCNENEKESIHIQSKPREFRDSWKSNNSNFKEVEEIAIREEKLERSNWKCTMLEKGKGRKEHKTVSKNISGECEEELKELNETNKERIELDIVLKYASEQIRKSLLLDHHFINNKEFYMSLSLICNQLATNGFAEKRFWHFLSVKLIELLKVQNIYETMCIRWLALILNSFARIHYFNQLFLERVTSFIIHYPNEDMHSFDISQIVNSYAKLGYLDLNFFLFFEKIIYDKREEMSCQSLSNICNAYSKLNDFENLFFNLSKSIKDKIDKFNEQEIANIVNSYSKLEKVDLELFYQFARRINDRIFSFKPIEIVMIANAYAKCNIYKKSLFDNLTVYIIQKEDSFTPAELSILANSYGKFNLKELRIFNIIKKGIIEKEHLLSPGNVAMLFHAYGKLAIRENIFLINLIKRKKHFIQNLDCRNLTLIYVSVIKLNLDIPFYIYNDMKRFILKNRNKFTDLALVSIGYSSLFYKYFDLILISCTLIVLNKRKAHSKSFAHQIQVILFVLNYFYNFSKFSYRFLLCLNSLLQRASLYSTKENYYDINKSSMQKKILHFLPNNCHVLTEVSVGPFVVDFLLLHKTRYNHARYIDIHRSLK